MGRLAEAVSSLLLKVKGDAALRERAKAKNDEGDQQYAEGAHAEALRCYDEALRVLRRLDDSLGEAMVLARIGLVHSAMERRFEGLKQVERALAIVRREQLPLGERNLLRNLASVCTFFAEATAERREARQGDAGHQSGSRWNGFVSWLSEHGTGVVGFVTAMSLIFGGIWSVTQYVDQQQKQTEQRAREQADTVRTAAAEALAKLDRYARLPESLAERTQGLAVETSVNLADHKDVGEARDLLWKGLNEAWREVRATQRAEGIELAHVKLYGRRPDAYAGMAATLSQLDGVASECFAALLLAEQRKVLAYEGKLQGYQAAQLGDDLRDVLGEFRDALDRRAEEALRPVRIRLEAVIAGHDEQVLDRSWDPVGSTNGPSARGETTAKVNAPCAL